MFKTTLEASEPVREPVAALAITGGLFLQDAHGNVNYVAPCGAVVQECGHTIKGILEQGCGRKPIYPGDKVTLQF